MGKRIVLHVGAMKSGTSYLQTLLMDNKARLAEHGVVVPGARWGDQVAGVSHVLERQKVMRKPGEDAWQSLVDEVQAHDGTSVISMEFLGPVGLPKIEKVRDSFDGMRVEAVITARDLGRNIPAMWQEFVKNGGTTSLERYVEKVRARGGGRPVLARAEHRRHGPSLVRRARPRRGDRGDGAEAGCAGGGAVEAVRPDPGGRPGCGRPAGQVQRVAGAPRRSRWSAA
ncbi:hypothetical protein [Nocardioides daphniae]|uniref:Sulfotransferase family protein n=1 Tax=Nocardioides daphniae TaxID=402297 RepID=A0A4P7UCP4_9ACTN|nr:hypothetical protein [Nocardioides daphniae]QCC77816.1 hypothetical protein E2C04_12665 [Nocardioides daphniae]